MSWSREESPDRLGTLWSLNRFLGMEAVIVQGVSFNRLCKRIRPLSCETCGVLFLYSLVIFVGEDEVSLLKVKVRSAV